ncbi:MAG TPA: relaxase/mobilization nuclease domain-containing protein, partial [Candidatus Cybelea sp.]
RTFAIGVDYITEHTHQRAVASAGHAFEGGVSYASAPEKAEWVHLRGVTSVETAAIEMEAVALLSKRCRDPVYHMIIAYAKNERPTREQVVSDAERLLKAIGMERSQYVLAAHKDTDDFHAHVIANRIGADTKANDLWHERIKRERVCAEIAAERGWTIVLGHHNRDIVQRVEHLYAPPPDPQRRLSDGAYRRLHERGELPWQESARPYVLDAVDRAKGWDDLRQRLRAHGVVVKLVRRGERVQGLAFAEGLDRRAPGCAASRIDARCALRAMESRFGPFTPAREPIAEIARSAPWADTVRPTILAAVDAAKTWGDLEQRLDRDGIVIKLIRRGTRVQGMAFAAGSDPQAPGCGASRIHPRCKKAVLEQRFGPCPYVPEQPPKRSRSTIGDRAEREARSDPRWALRDAQRIADHARLRSEYRAYRERFFSERAQAMGARRDGAWERERAQRQRDAQRRREARLLLCAVARLGTRGVIARQLAYWSVDAIIGRRRAREHDAARVRWEARKIVLASERTLAREKKPLAYRSFVSERARSGDPGAQRVLDVLVAPTRNRSEHVPQRDLHPVTLAEIRLRLNAIRAEEDGRYQRARFERQHLEHVARPPTLEEALAAERRRIDERATDATRYTDAERVRLARLARERRSWNPLTRRAATREEERLSGEQRFRYEKALAVATHEFEQRDLPDFEERLAGQERVYRRYVAASLGLERERNNARAARDEVPRIEQRLNVLERAGVARIDCDAAMGGARLDGLAAAIERQYQALPHEIRRDVGHSIRKEQRARDSMTIAR